MMLAAVPNGWEDRSAWRSGKDDWIVLREFAERARTRAETF